jgi:2-haloalkanoic acid dehalogenase type II
LKDIRAITFDCYGTLIDWEGGAKQSLRVLLQKRRPRDKGLFRAEFLDELFGAWERAQWTRIQQSYTCYRQIAAESLEQVAAEHELPFTGADACAFANSIATWQPFPDTAAALAKLKQKVRLGLISNIDDDILAASAARLGVEFDLLMTAERARAYKPSPLPFQRALERLGLPAEQVAHAAFGFEYDITTASTLGFRTILVRRHRRKFPPAPAPDLIVADLAELAQTFG